MLGFRCELLHGGMEHGDEEVERCGRPIFGMREIGLGQERRLPPANKQELRPDKCIIRRRTNSTIHDLKDVL